MGMDVTTVEELQHVVAVAVEEATAEYRANWSDEDVPEDDIFRDMAVSMTLAHDIPREVAIEFFRRELGYIPHEYARWAKIPATDFLDD